MSATVAIRGWIECDDEQLKQVEAVIAAAAPAEPEYAKGWVVPRGSGSWTNYVFFGASVKERLAEWLRPQLEQIAALQPVSADEYVRGLFFVGSESGVAHEWLIKDGKLLESDASNKYVYLDA